MKRLTCLPCLVLLALCAAPMRATFASTIELTDLPGIAVSANSFTEGGEPANAIDNLDYVDGQFSWVAGDHGTPEDPNWLQLDFGSDYYLTSVEVRFVYNDGGWDGYNNVFNLWAQQESGAWVAIGSGDVQDSADLSLRDKTFNYAPGAQPVARYLRYEVVGGSHWSSLGEINVQGTPYAVPEPSTFVLAALGVLALMIVRKRQRAACAAIVLSTLALSAADAHAGTAFTSEFSSPTLNPGLQDVDGAYTIAGGTISKTVFNDADQRSYIRTVDSDYFAPGKDF